MSFLSCTIRRPSGLSSCVQLIRFLHDIAFAPIDKTAFLFAFPVEPPRASRKFPAIASSFESPPAAVSAADDVSWLVVVVVVVVVVVAAEMPSSSFLTKFFLICF